MDELRKTAKKLANSHRRIEPNLRRVIFFPDEKRQEVRLLEVVTGAFNGDEVYPFGFAKDEKHGVSFPMVLIQLSPRDFSRLRRQEIFLPADWHWDQREELYRA